MADVIKEPPGSHEPTAHEKTPKKAAASGWIGSALEYYDYFIYAQAAALVFPDLFFPSDNAQVGIIASFATFGVGYVARPIGAFVLGHWGDKHGRKNVLVLCMLLIGFSTFCVGLLPSYAAVGVLAPILLVALRLIQGFAVGGEISGASAMILEHSPFGRRGYYTSFTLQGVQAGQIFAAAIFLPLSIFLSKEAFYSWGWRIPFLLSAVVVLIGMYIRRQVHETPAFEEEAEGNEVPPSPIASAFKDNGLDMFKVFLMALMNAIPIAVTSFGTTFATNAAYGVGLTATNYLWISVSGNLVAVLLIPFVGNWSDRIGRRPVIIIGCLGSGILAYPYLYFVSEANLVMSFFFAMLMWGVVYQGYNAVFPSFFQELFPTKNRVTGFAIGQNFGTMVTSFLPAIYAFLAGPTPSDICVKDKTFQPNAITNTGETCRQVADSIEMQVVWVVGSITLGIAIIAALSAFWARETFRVHLDDLGVDGAMEVPKEEYDRIRRTGVDQPV
jgi:MFS family permease